MKILVTGGAGYVGSILIPDLLEKGYEVRCLDMFFFGKESLREVESDPKLELVKGDTRTFDPSLLRGITAVVDLAAIAQPDPTQQLDFGLFRDINQLGSIRIASLSKKYGVERYVLPSTCSVYGFQAEILNEKSPLNPIEAYSKTKAEAEKGVLALSDRDFSVTVLRFGTAYGLSPKMRFDLVINGMTLALFKTRIIKVMRNGTQWRPNIHVKDFAKALAMILETEKEVSGEIFNVGSNDQNFQIYSLAKLIGDSLGVPYEIEWYGDPDTRSYRVDFSKVNKVLGFRADYSPKDGAMEVYRALEDGIITDSPKTYILKWYTHLLATHAI